MTYAATRKRHSFTMVAAHRTCDTVAAVSPQCSLEAFSHSPFRDAGGVRCSSDALP